MSRFYVTTPIYYVNAVPHLGTFYTTVVADALARYHRARYGAESTYFLTGLDEHGQKIERIARDRGLEPKAYVDEIAARFQETWRRSNISNDHFIRTTDPDHRAAVEEMWRRMEAAGDIYASEYDGLYCVGCEESKSEDDVVTNDAGEKLCPLHQRPVERVKEKNYFFRLSRFADRLLEWYARGDVVYPEVRLNEVTEFVKRGLRDISISRASVKWGIPVPGDPKQVIYVWVDALTNYLTPLGGPAAVETKQGRAALWEASHHLIAKDILRFHAVFWPAFLMSAGLPPPRAVLCHGYITVKGQKISKTIPATRVDPNAIAAEIGVDPLRYFVLREYTLGSDGDFTYEALFGRHEADLGNDLGNLLNRTLAMVHRFVGESLPPRPESVPVTDFEVLAQAKLGEAQRHWGEFAPSRALEATWDIIRAANVFVDKSAPWKIMKGPNGAEAVKPVLAICCEALRWAALMVAPAMPATAREMLKQLGREIDEGKWPDPSWRWPGGTLGDPTPLFPRIEPERQAALVAKWMPSEAPAMPPAPAGAAQPPPAPAPEQAPSEIAYDEFQRLDLRAAKVIACERVPKTEKLLKLTLDLGETQRTVVSGIADVYPPEQMVGRTVVYLANLKPAKIRGVLSHGMILAAGDAAVQALCGLDREVAPGTRIR